MKKTLLPGLIIYALVLAGLGTRNGCFFALAIPFIIYLAAGLFFEPASPQLTLERTLSANRVTPDQSVTLTLTVTNQGQTLEELHLADTVPPSLVILNGETSLFTTLHPGQSAQVQYTVLGRRGLYRFSEVSLKVGEHLGLFKRHVTLSAPGQFFVLPEISKVKQVAIRPPRTGIYSGLVPARQGGPGVEFFGIREYQPGDPLRWVNQRAGARYPQTLFVNEFQQERVVDVGLILDARRQSDAQRVSDTGPGSESLFEYSVEAAATLAETFLDSGNRVGLFIYGRSLDWTFPGYGKLQKERIIRSLARAKLGDGKIFKKLEHLPTRLFPVRSQLVLLSPLLAGDADMLIKLRARGYRLLVISPNPVTFERSGLADNDNINLATRIVRAERDLLKTKLTEAEIQVVDWPVETPFYQVAHTALSRLPFHRGRALV